MPRYAYDHLTFLDNSFLIMEGPNAPMHIAGTATFEGGALIGADGVNSEVRKLVMPDIPFLDFGGVYVGMTIKVDHGLPVSDGNSYWGRGRLVALFPVDAERIEQPYSRLPVPHQDQIHQE